MKRLLTILGIVVIFYACTLQPSERDIEQPSGSSQDKKLVSYAREIVPIFSRNCYSCHSNNKVAGNLDFTNYDDVYITVISGTLISPQGSLPKCALCNGKAIDQFSISRIKQWVADGALYN